MTRSITKVKAITPLPLPHEWTDETRAEINESVKNENKRYVKLLDVARNFLKKTPNTNIEGMSADKIVEMYLVQINNQSPFSHHSGGKRRSITNKNKKKIKKRNKTMKKRNKTMKKRNKTMKRR